MSAKPSRIAGETEIIIGEASINPSGLEMIETIAGFIDGPLFAVAFMTRLFLQEIHSATSDQEAALSSIGLTELQRSTLPARSRRHSYPALKQGPLLFVPEFHLGFQFASRVLRPLGLFLLCLCGSIELPEQFRKIDIQCLQLLKDIEHQAR